MSGHANPEEEPLTGRTDGRQADAAERQAEALEQIASEVAAAARRVQAVCQGLQPVLTQIGQQVAAFGHAATRALEAFARTQEYSRLDTHD